jgi:hypothetical protein
MMMKAVVMLVLVAPLSVLGPESEGVGTLVVSGIGAAVVGATVDV